MNPNKIVDKTKILLWNHKWLLFWVSFRLKSLGHLESYGAWVWASMVSNTCLTDSCDCVFHIDAYTPVSDPMPINSSCVPCSAMVPSLRTTIRSACLMVDNRWAIAIVVLPLHTLVWQSEGNIQSKWGPKVAQTPGFENMKNAHKIEVVYFYKMREIPSNQL